MPGSLKREAMDTNQLRVYVAVARHRSISAAARELSISQPSVTRLIQRLEGELRVRLIERCQRPFALTQAGEELLSYAQRALVDWQDTVQRLQAQSTRVGGRLRIAASTTPGEYVVPRLLTMFIRAFPEVEPMVAIVNTQKVIEQVLEGQCDVGFAGSPIATSNLNMVKVAEDDVVLAVPEGHAFSREASVPLERLAGQPLILREGGSGTFQSLLRRLDEQGLSLPDHKVAMVLGNTQAIVAAVRAGLGIGFVSSLALAGLPSEEIKGVNIRGVDLRRALYLVYEESRITGPLLQEFVSFVREQTSGQA